MRGKRRLRLPRYSTVPSGLAKKAAGSIQSRQARVAPAQAPRPYGLPTRFGRSCPSAVREPALVLLTPESSVIGRPVCADTRPLNCQPPRVLRTKPFVFVRVGSCHTYDATKRCLWSNSEGP